MPRRRIAEMRGATAGIASLAVAERWDRTSTQYVDDSRSWPIPSRRRHSHRPRKGART
jgi:hypothetical protein